MKEWLLILSFEIKKIIKRKSTWIAFMILLGLQIVVGFSGNLGTTYVNDTFVETHAERNKIDRKNGLELSGRPFDNTLLQEMQDAYAKIELTDDKTYILSETWQEEVRKYEELYILTRMWVGSNAIQNHTITIEILEDIWETQTVSMQENYKLTQAESTYWKEKENVLPETYTYQYATAYATLIDMTGIYMTCMLLMFFIVICMGNIFTEEHIRKTDQLILSTKNGRKQLYFAKIVAGSIVTFVVSLFFLMINIVGHFYAYGVEGFFASLQLVTGGMWYKYPICVGEVLLIMIGILLLASIMLTILMMLLAETMKNSAGAMAIIIGIFMFAARLISIPTSLKALSQLWNLLPLNILKIDAGFMDLRLFDIFGIQLTSWQFAPILYSIVILVCVLLGMKKYCKIQKNY